MKRLGWSLAVVGVVLFICTVDSGWAWLAIVLMWAAAFVVARAYEAEVYTYGVDEVADLLDEQRRAQR